ncbi:MAG: phosphoribosylformylglycinamidine synthase subunit PurL [Alicyclobacillaceae bacterium]|nr:phosphoribosylformylglycinamidine synthase subunit PurL [Alicyclobacillaceae bacterium]
MAADRAPRWLQDGGPATGAGAPAGVAGTPAPAAGPAEQRGEPGPEEIRDRRLYRDLGLTDDEYERVVNLIGRLPNYVETGLFGVLWSEHCSYKSSKIHLRKFPTSGPQVLQGPGENAGVVDIGGGLGIAFKMESHNHPSAVEPYQGAATGVGGILRDIYTMGARPVTFLDSLRFGDIADARTRYLFAQVVAGIGGYGNCVGIPTVGGEALFDPTYQHNPLVNAMCVGVVRADRLVKGVAAGVGNPVFVVGSRTGRDGIHGATFASAEDPEAKERSAVQVGDPFLGKLLMEACLELMETGAVVGVQDMGAAGLTSSSAEMASRASGGIELFLDRVPVRESGMTPYEMMLSESQERMLVVLQRGREQVAFDIFQKWGLQVAEVGRVTDDGMLRLWFRGEVVAEVPVRALVDEAPVYDRPAVARPRTAEDEARERAAAERLVAKVAEVRPQPVPEGAGAPAASRDARTARAAGDAKDGQRDGGFAPHLLELLRHPSIADKRWIYQQYDTSVRTCTYTGPGSDAAVLLVPDTDRAIALATDGNGRYVYLNPRRGGAIAVAEASRNVACAGGRPLAITNCLNFGNPEKPHVMYQLVQAIEGISEACRALDTPVVSGNVSLYNESRGQDIHPTPVIGVVGKVEDVGKVPAGAFVRAGSAVVLLGRPDTSLDGTLYWQLAAGHPAGDAPRLELEEERRLQQLLLALVAETRVLSLHDVSDGGLAVCLAEMCIRGRMGARVRMTEDVRTGAEDEQARLLAAAGWLFSEAQSRVVAEVEPDQVGAVLAQAEAFGVPAAVLGETGGDELVVTSPGGRCLWLRADVAALADAFEQSLPLWMAR